MSKWTKLIPDGKGGFDAFEGWNLGLEILYQGAWKLIFGFAFAIVFGALMPLLLFITYPFATEKGRKTNIAISIVASLVYLLDFWLGGVIWTMFGGVESAAFLGWFAQLNLTLLCLNVICWFISAEFYEKIAFTFSTVIFYVAIFLIGYNFIWPLFDGIAGSISDTPLWFLEGLFNNK
jgi:hypothetical protein